MRPLIPFKKFTDSELHQETHAAALREKAACLELLQNLAEVDRRRLYSARSYSSLWEYVHRALGYSEAQASERVAAMRLMVRVPEVTEGLKTGELSLTSTAKLASHVCRERASPEKTRELLELVRGRPTREVERILADSSTVLPARSDQIRPLDAERTRVTLEVDAEFMALLERARELGGHAGSTPQEVLKGALREYVGRKEVRKEVRKPPSTSLLRAPEVEANTRYVRVAARDLIRRRSGDRCEFIDSATGRRCESRTRLEFDHIRPHALGGPPSVENLRHLCRGHNVFEGIRVFGAEKLKVGRNSSP